MAMFHPENRSRSRAHARFHAACEFAITVAEFAAALFFIIGSIFFFYDSLQHAGTWLFLVGSVFFAARPAIKVFREARLLAMGDIDALSDDLE